MASAPEDHSKIVDLLATGRTLSFEFFPPKNDEAERQLEKSIHELAPLRPSFVSVTYGAGGSTRDRTRDIVLQVNREQAFPAMAHLTCVGHGRSQVVDLLDEYAAGGVHNILALAGDPPADGSDPGGDFTYALELVELVRAHPGGFSVGVAAHPEGHPKSPDMETDRRWTAEKLRHADFGVTQFFFDNAAYYRMLDELSRLGVDTPVIPGIMPVTNAGSVQRMAELSGAEFPPDLAERVAAVGDDPEAVRRIGVEMSTAMCEDLLAHDVPGLHFYTLNRSTATREIYANLGLG